MLSEQELNLIHRFILLTTVRKALEKDFQQFNDIPFKFQNLYIEHHKQILDQVSKELAHLKRALSIRQIKIEHIKNDGLFSQFHYYYRGYLENHKILNTHLKNQSYNYVSHFFSN